MTLNLPSTFAIFTTAIAFSSAVDAQLGYGASDQYFEAVTVYEHCDFRGKSQTFRPGKYPSLRDVGFGNDKVSSIRVPRGSEVVIYQDDDYRGSYARIDKDIRCFDKRWNDQASSIRVREVAYSNDRGDRGNNDRNAENGDKLNHDSRRHDDRRNNHDRQNRQNVTVKNIAHVVFDGASLQQVSSSQWSLDSTQSAAKQFQEVRRSEDSVYLENKYTSERVRIDLFANDVTFVGRDGRQQRYTIDRKNAALGSNANSDTGRVRSPASPVERAIRIRSSCFDFKAYTQGGGGGVRFRGKEGFHQFASKANSGRVCHKGPLTMEIGKTSPKTDVTVEIDGEKYRFAANEKEDKRLGSWYRKYVKFQVGR